MINTVKIPQHFGALLGYVPGNVPAYSSDYEPTPTTDYPEHSAYYSYVDGVYMGYKMNKVNIL